MPIKPEASFFGSRNFYLMLFFPFTLVLLFVWLKTQHNITRDPMSLRQKAANRLAKKYLSSAKKNLGNKETFYNSLERALQNYLKAKLHIVTAEFSKTRITNLLKEKEIEPGVIKEFLLLLEACEAARYSPATTVSMQENFDRASILISKIDKQL